uniref:pecanex-like protein 4 n=1 Tax=Styela clava TaxID=7725 RepID=UPI00193A3C73|nr:pecanex-like protein 4 [Styela clava]
MAGSDIPLLNHYKKEFVYKRLPQTFFGGLNLKLGYAVPWYIYICQILLWLMPFFIGGAFTLGVEVGGLAPFHACIGNGLVVGIITLLLQVGSKVISRGSSEIEDSDKFSLSSAASVSSKKLRRLLAEEDEIIFESCLSSNTFLFLVPPKRFYLSIVTASLLSIFVNGLGMWYSLPYTTFTTLYGYNTVSSIFLFIFCWIVICVAQYPLLLGNPIPETAAYRSVDFYETQNLWRSLTVSLFLIVFLVDILVDSAVLTIVNNVLHIVFCTLPALWLLGIIPPFDALSLWFMEQFLTFGLGGSCMSTDWRLLFMTIISSSVLIGLSFATSAQIIISCSVAFGYLFSTDITSLCFNAVSHFRFIKDFCGRKTKVEEFNEDHITDANSNGLQVSWKQIVTHSVMFTLVFTGTFLAHYYGSSVSGNTGVKSALEYVFIGIFVVTLVFREFQRVYFCFGIFRNCFYPVSTLSQSKFQKRKKLLSWLGIIHGIFLYIIFPISSSIYLSFFIFSTSTTSFPSFEVALGCIHGMRFVWQRPGNALFSFAILSILNLISDLNSTTWGTLFMGTRLIILDICRDRFFQFLDNLWFALTLMVTSWTDKKQRRSMTIPLICLNIIFFPFTLAIIGIASVLSAPFLPLFTLPIFTIGFPRPSKFWASQPGSAQANICPDTIYYQQMVEPVCKWFSSEVGLGIVSAQASSSSLPSFYIARSQDRTLWIQVLESGCGYVSFSMKGLELQETSCHALEATRLDDAFDIAFEKTELDLRCLRTNQYVGTSSVTPVDSAFIDSHSDAKNSLRGIIDHPDTMKQLRADFLKSLSWIIVQHIISNNKKMGATENNKNKPSENQNNSEKDILLISNKPHELSVQNLKKPATLNNFPHPNSVVESDVGDARSVVVHSIRSDSLVSFTSILTSDDERPLSRTRGSMKNLKNGKAMEMKQRKSGIGGRQGSSKKMQNNKSSDNDEWDIDSILSDSGYGLPAIDADKKKMKNTPVVMSDSAFGHNMDSGLSESYVQLYDEKTIQNDNNKLFFKLIPSKWNEIPISSDDITDSMRILDLKWLEHCLKSSVEKYGSEIFVTPAIVSSLAKLITSCDSIVNMMGVPGKNSSLLGTEHMQQVYYDKIPWSPALDWLKARKDLHDIVITAYRYAVKLMYDQVSLGPAESNDELSEYFTEYDDEWFIGIESDPKWRKGLVDGNSHLFALCHNSVKKELSVRTLTKQSVSMHFGRVNPAAVRGIWSNFALEMIYATNDDEERYSIQAHQALLRNLIVQTSDPPLGYPIFSSKPLNTSTLPLK